MALFRKGLREIFAGLAATPPAGMSVAQREALKDAEAVIKEWETFQSDMEDDSTPEPELLEDSESSYCEDEE